MLACIVTWNCRVRWREEVESEQFRICMVVDSRKEDNVDKRMKHRSELCMTFVRHGGY